MNPGTVAAGAGAALFGVGVLYAARRLLPRADLPDEIAVYLRLLTALFASVAITLGLLTAFFGIVAA